MLMGWVLRARDEGSGLGWDFKKSRGQMLRNAELREFLSGVGGETWWQVAGFRTDAICETSRDPQQDLWVAPGVGPGEGGDSIFLVALPYPAVTLAGAGEVDSWLKPGLGFFQRRPEGKEMKPKGRKAQAEPVDRWP